MTVQAQTSITEYTANGSARFFAYGFDTPLDFTVFVTVDNLLMPFSQQETGILFEEAPEAGSIVRIYRASRIDQLRDWRVFGPFEAEKTEEALDKLIILKQEAWDWRANLNLVSELRPDRIIIRNDKGEDANLLLWTNDYAGLFAGEATEQAPEDATVTQAPRNFCWFQWDRLDVPEPPTDGKFASEPYPVLTGDSITIDAELVRGEVRKWFEAPQFAMQDASLEDITLQTVIAYKTEGPYDGGQIAMQDPSLLSITLEAIIAYRTIGPYDGGQIAMQDPTLLGISLEKVIEYTNHTEVDESRIAPSAELKSIVLE